MLCFKYVFHFLFLSDLFPMHSRYDHTVHRIIYDIHYQTADFSDKTSWIAELRADVFRNLAHIVMPHFTDFHYTLSIA